MVGGIDPLDSHAPAGPGTLAAPNAGYQKNRYSHSGHHEADHPGSAPAFANMAMTGTAAIAAKRTARAKVRRRLQGEVALAYPASLHLLSSNRDDHDLSLPSRQTRAGGFSGFRFAIAETAMAITASRSAARPPS